MPRIRHFMIRKFFEKAHERHLSLRRHMRGIWETYISLRKHMGGIARWGDIWEASLIEETSERHLRGTHERHSSLRRHLRGISHWGNVWETSQRFRVWKNMVFLWFSYVSRNNLLKSIVFSSILLNCPIQYIDFLTFYKQTISKVMCFWYMVTRCISF